MTENLVVRYANPVVQTIPGPEFKVREIELIPHPKGAWVRFEDYERLRAALDKIAEYGECRCGCYSGGCGRRWSGSSILPPEHGRLISPAKPYPRIVRPMAIEQFHIGIEYTKAEDGYWVRYDDHLSALESLEEALREIAKGIDPSDYGSYTACEKRLVAIAIEALEKC